MVTEDPHFGDESTDKRRDQKEDVTGPVPSAHDAGGAGGGGFAADDTFDFDEAEFARLEAEPIPFEFDSQVGPLPETEASELVRKYLFPTEKFRGEWRRHWVHLTKVLTVGVLATFVLGYASGFFAKKNVPYALSILVVIWLAVMGWVLWAVAEWYYDRFVLTNKRLMLVEGIVARDVAMMPLSRVTDMKYTQSAMGRMLGYGTFEIESAGQDQALRKISNLPNPTDLYLQVVEEMYEPEASEARRRVPDDDGT